MKTLRSKYSQGDIKNKWKIQQCQSEKLYFNYHKDCEHCEGRAYCYSEEFRPYYVNVSSSMLIFADTYENARAYAGKGHGWLIEKESISGLPVALNVDGDCITFQPCID